MTSLGVQAFQHFLTLLAEAGDHITSADVRRAAEAASGRDLHWFFQQWVSERVWLDYAVGRVETAPHTEASGRTMYSNRVEIRRLGEAIMPLTVRLIARDGTIYDTALDGTAQTAVVTWESAAPLQDVHIDPEHTLPDVQRLNDVYHVPYTVRPLIDFPRLDRYLLYPFVTLDNNFIDGYMPRLHLIALYLDEQAATVSIGRKEALDELSVEAQLLRNRFPVPGMTSSLSLSDRQGARTVSLETSLLLRESHQHYLTPANRFTLGYNIAFLERLTEFNGEVVPADFAPSTGRVHSVVLRYLRDTRIPTPVGAPLNVLAEPLAYGYALRLETELAARILGSTEPDFQQVRGEVSDYLRLWNQTSLQLRLFGGWSAGTLPLQRKLSLAGIDTVRGYPYRLQFLGDRLLGGTLSLRFPVLPDVRVDLPGRYFGLRSFHIAPFVDSGWVWNRDQSITDVSPRSSAGLRLIAGFGFASLLRFEVVADLAVPVDERGRREDAGLQAWVRLQSTVGGGLPVTSGSCSTHWGMCSGWTIPTLRGRRVRCTRPSRSLRTSVTPQFKLVPIGIPEFELLTVALGPPGRTDRFFDLDAFRLQLCMQMVHVGRAKHQAIMIHVRGHTLPGGDGPNVDDGLGGDPRRYKAHFPSLELLQPQELQAQHLMIEVHGLLDILGVDHNVIQSHHVHRSLPRDFPCAPRCVRHVPVWIVAETSAAGQSDVSRILCRLARGVNPRYREHTVHGLMAPGGSPICRQLWLTSTQKRVYHEPWKHTSACHRPSVFASAASPRPYWVWG